MTDLLAEVTDHAVEPPRPDLYVVVAYYHQLGVWEVTCDSFTTREQAEEYATRHPRAKAWLYPKIVRIPGVE
jgi:hypothetical protein